MHAASVQTLYRIHDTNLLSFETASELILGGLGDLRILKIAFPSQRDFVFGREFP